MHAEQIADGVASAVSHPITVQVINQGPGVWGNVATGLITACAAIVAVMLTHRFTLKRERLAAQEKLQREQLFIGAELVYLLERFAQACIYPAEDIGYTDDKGNMTLIHTLPEFDYSTVTGDWRSLPNELIYRLFEFPVNHEEARRSVDAASKNIATYSDLISGRLQMESSRLGLIAIQLSRDLRRLCKMPDDQMSKYEWSTWKVLERINQRCMENLVRKMRIKPNTDDETTNTSTVVTNGAAGEL